MNPRSADYQCIWWNSVEDSLEAAFLTLDLLCSKKHNTRIFLTNSACCSQIQANCFEERREILRKDEEGTETFKYIIGTIKV